MVSVISEVLLHNLFTIRSRNSGFLLCLTAGGEIRRVGGKMFRFSQTGDHYRVTWQEHVIWTLKYGAWRVGQKMTGRRLMWGKLKILMVLLIKIVSPTCTLREIMGTSIHSMYFQFISLESVLQNLKRSWIGDC